MATPIEETLESNLKVRKQKHTLNLICLGNDILVSSILNQVRTGIVSISDGKSSPEPARLRLTMELLILQRLDTSTPISNIGPPNEKVCFVYLMILETPLFFTHSRNLELFNEKWLIFITSPKCRNVWCKSDVIEIVA